MNPLRACFIMTFSFDSLIYTWLLSPCVVGKENSLPILVIFELSTSITGINHCCVKYFFQRRNSAAMARFQLTFIVTMNRTPAN